MRSTNVFGNQDEHEVHEADSEVLPFSHVDSKCKEEGAYELIEVDFDERGLRVLLGKLHY